MNAFYGKFCFYFVLTYFVTYTNGLVAQPNNRYVSGTVLPAPNAGALGKYGDIPVSYYTGIPSIEIPIASLEEGPLKMPISLNYHASGMKVAEMASWVGSGWSLNAGGIITRTVQGIPDETFPKGYYHYGNIAPTPSSNTADWDTYRQECVLGQADSEPDLFTFNVGGYSGKFYIDHKDAPTQGKPLYQFIPKQDLKLEFTPDFTQFVLIGTDGTRYTFGQAMINGANVTAREFTKQHNEADTKKHCTSWYLLLVESADLNYKITLNYDNEYYSYLNPTTCSFIAINDLCNTGVGYSASPSGYEECVGTSVDPYHYAIRTEIEGKRLISIQTSSKTATFQGTVNRDDIDDHTQYATSWKAKRLEKIEISSGSPQVLCQKFDFSYSYFQDPANNTTSYHKRLKLDQITEKSCDGAIINTPYLFSYEGTFLRNRLSKATDHWGYDNGAVANDNMKVSVPPTTLTIPNTFNLYTYGTANKETSEPSLKKGVLTQISYPTGGKTWFTYEANQVYATVNTTVNKLSLQSCINTPSNCCGTQTGTSGNIQFTSDELSNNATKFKLQLWPLLSNSGGSQLPYPCNSATTVTGSVQAFRSSDNAAVGQPFSFNINATDPTGSIEKPLSFLEGYLTFQAATNYYFKIITVHAYGTLTITSAPYVAQNYMCGGLRIKEIRSSASSTQSNDDVIRSYEYLQNGTSNSSGKLYGKPTYGFNVGECVNAYPYPFCWKRMFFQENSITPMFNFNGNHYGYERVKESFNGNGYTVYTFTTGNTIALSNYPVVPFTYDETAGAIVSQKEHNNSGVVVSETNNVAGGSSYSWNAKLIYKFANYHASCNHPFYGVTHEYDYFLASSYFIRTGAYLLASKSETIDGVTTVTSYSYDPTYRFLAPIAVQFTNSDSKVIRTEYKYPHEMPSGCIRDFLLQKNIIASPWRTVQKVGGTEIDGTEVTYASFTPTGTFSSTSTCANPGFVRPYQFKRYEMTWDAAGNVQTGSWKNRGTINAYNTKGLPAQYTAENWLSEYYTWETNGLIKSNTYNGYTTNYHYHSGTRLPSRIVQPDGQEVWYDYDKLGRLSKSWARPSLAGTKSSAQVTTEYEYRYRAQTIPSNPYAENYVRIKNNFSTAPSGGGTSALTGREVIAFFDGLGREYQSVNRAQSPTQKDVVTYTKFDKWGRIIRVYNPVETANNTGAPLTQEPITHPASLTEYYADPLNRVWKEIPPSWYATIYEYGSNTGASEVLLNHTTNTYYPVNTLRKITVTDPDNKRKINYTDRKGRSLMNWQTDVSFANHARTYTLYDDKDRISRIIPPGAGINDANLIFTYQYDAADNVVSKKVPDAAPVAIKYNVRDQMVLEQDGTLLAQNKWRCTQYDDFGRVIKTGLFSGTVPGTIPVTFAPSDLYTENIYGTAGIERGKIKTEKSKVLDGAGTWLQTTFNYDIYGRVSSTTGNNYLLPTDLNAESVSYIYDFSDNVLLDTRISKKTSANSYTIAQKHNYDHWGRNTLNTHEVGSAGEQVLSQLNYNWRNEVIERNIGKSPLVTNYLQSLDYAYNAQGWMLSINGASLGGSNISMTACPTAAGMPNPGTASGTLDLNDLFYMELKYETLQGGLSGTTNKNGNISQMIWRVRGRERQSYTMTYDFLNRMQTSSYRNLNDAGTAVNNSGAWDENLSYDARGNILTLTRNGKYKTIPSATCWTDGQIDNLAYTYVPGYNRLQKIADNAPTVSRAEGWKNATNATATASYAYDVDGKMISDPYKGLNITYNFLNLPSLFSFSGNTKQIQVLYDGRGRKIRKIVTDNSVMQYQQDYVFGIEYRTTNTVALSTESIAHAEGRVFNINAGTTLKETLRYEYALKDHLGNTRLTFTDKNNNGVVDVNNTPSNEILQENHYYPFGLEMNGPWINDAAMDYLYKYNGKELNNDFGLGYYDYGNRYYDCSTGRFIYTDPIAEKFPHVSPYNFAENHVPNAIDLWGLQSFDFRGLWNTLGLSSYNNSIVQGSQDLKVTDEAANRTKLAGAGLLNVVMGVIGTNAAAGGAPFSDGATALAIPLTVGQTSIGVVQLTDAVLGENPDPESPLHESSNMPGLIAHGAGSPNAGTVDLIGSLTPGALAKGGNIGQLITDGQTLVKALKGTETISEAKAITTGLSLVDGVRNVYAAGSLVNDGIQKAINPETKSPGSSTSNNVIIPFRPTNGVLGSAQNGFMINN